VLYTAAHAQAEVADAIPQLGDLERWTAFFLGGGYRPSLAFDIYLSTVTLASPEPETF